MATPTGGGTLWQLIANSGDVRIDSLTSDTRWGTNGIGTSVTLTYSFPEGTATYLPPYSEFTDGWASLTGTQQGYARQALQEWANVANITFQEVADDSTIVGDMRIAKFDGSGQSGHAYYPGGTYDVGTGIGDTTTPKSGDVWLNYNVTSNSNPAPDTFGFYTLLHEIGHALGLKHPFDDSPILTGAEDSVQYTVMSYTVNGYTYPVTPMLYDILAIQYLYGANMSYRTGDDNYTFSSGQVMTIWDAGGADTITGSGAISLLQGSFSQVSGAQIAIAYNVTIENAVGAESSDTIIGNEVGNKLIGNGGNDSIFAGDGDDWAHGNQGNDTIHGGLGNDSVLGGQDADVLMGDEGDDILRGALGNDSMSGGAGNDTFYAGQNEDTLLGGDGNDWLYGLLGDDYIDGQGNDDYIEGADGNDLLYGGAGNDFVHGNTGSDLVFGSTGNDTVAGGKDDDFVDGGDGDDWVRGGMGNDALSGNAGNDLLSAGQGNDTLIAGNDNDVLEGRRGNDLLTGESGADIFWFNEAGPETADTITDFTPGQDHIELESTFFMALSVGSLPSGQFVSGAGVTASDPGHFVLYDTASSALWYDADGNGAVDALLIATLSNAPSLSAGDILVS